MQCRHALLSFVNAMSSLPAFHKNINSTIQPPLATQCHSVYYVMDTRGTPPVSRAGAEDQAIGVELGTCQG